MYFRTDLKMNVHLQLSALLTILSRLLPTIMDIMTAIVNKSHSHKKLSTSGSSCPHRSILTASGTRCGDRLKCSTTNLLTRHPHPPLWTRTAAMNMNLNQLYGISTPPVEEEADQYIRILRGFWLVRKNFVFLFGCDV